MSRRLLITGGCGYFGAQLIRDLATHPPEGVTALRILDNLQTGSVQALMDLPAGVDYEFIEGDILDPAAAGRALDGVDAVVHLAALAKTPFSFDHPAWTEQVNHWGTAHLIDHCLRAGVYRFIYAGSTAVYGAGGPHAETANCRPIGPYAASKLNAEGTVLGAVSRGLNPTILRFGTLYGFTPSFRFDAVVNRFGYLAGVGKALTVYGRGMQQRPIVHVNDACAAVRFVLARPDETDGVVLNVSAENASVLRIADAARAAFPGATVRYVEQGILTYVSLQVDTSALTALGWAPAYTLEDGFAELAGRFRYLGGMGLRGE